MDLGTYYNEHEPFAADWLRQLIAAGLLPPGFVDARDIQNVKPEELEGFQACNFFAGIGGWSEALRLANWPTDEPVWTGSCPCQPFSVAGALEGNKDERNLWPVWFPIIRKRHPPVIFGEQVASAVTHGWLDQVAHDLEAEGYSVAAAVLPACSVTAPHQRDRLWFVADTQSTEPARPEHTRRRLRGPSIRGSAVAESTGEGLEKRERIGRHPSQKLETAKRAHTVANAGSGRRDKPNQGESEQPRRAEVIRPSQESIWLSTGEPSVLCGDGKQRPVKPGVRLLVDGLSGRVGRIRGYGNAIVPQVAAEFIRAYREARGLRPYGQG